MTLVETIHPASHWELLRVVTRDVASMQENKSMEALQYAKSYF